MKFGRVDYADSTPPQGYTCTGCGAHGVKLWREYNMLADHIRLLCCDCASEEAGEPKPDVDAKGRVACHDVDPEYRTDQIGHRVPAVPTEEGDTFWGYTSVPAAGVAWWRGLANRLGGA